MTLREILDEVKKCQQTITDAQEWEQFLDQEIYVFSDPDLGPYECQMVGLCGAFLPLGLKLVIQPKWEET